MEIGIIDSGFWHVHDEYNIDFIMVRYKILNFFNICAVSYTDNTFSEIIDSWLPLSASSKVRKSVGDILIKPIHDTKIIKIFLNFIKQKYNLELKFNLDLV